MRFTKGREVMDVFILAGALMALLTTGLMVVLGHTVHMHAQKPYHPRHL